MDTEHCGPDILTGEEKGAHKLIYSNRWFNRRVKVEVVLCDMEWKGWGWKLPVPHRPGPWPWGRRLHQEV